MMIKSKRKKDKTVSYMSLPGLLAETKLPPVRRQHPDYIEAYVTANLNVPINKIKGKTRTREIAFCRQVVMFLIRRYTQLSLKDVGSRYNRDHTTVMHSVRLVGNLMESDPIIRSQVRHLETHIQQS